MLKRKSRPVYAKKLLGINTQGKWTLSAFREIQLINLKQSSKLTKCHLKFHHKFKITRSQIVSNFNHKKKYPPRKIP